MQRRRIVPNIKRVQTVRSDKVQNKKRQGIYRHSRVEYPDTGPDSGIDRQNPWNDLKYSYKRKRNPFNPTDVRVVYTDAYVSNDSMKKYGIGRIIKNSRKFY
jgi:hypothetical protein